MPQWRKKNILMVSIAFAITLIVLFAIGFSNFSDTFKFIISGVVMIATVVVIIIINERKLKKENENLNNK